jgi:multidrug resistance efflux pump
MATTTEPAAPASPVLRTDAGTARRPAPRGKSKLRRIVVVVGAVLASAGILAAASSQLKTRNAALVDSKQATFPAVKGILLVTVTEDGNLESASNVDVKCQVLGGSTILWIVPDGSTVKKGDEIVRLDAATIEDQVNTQKIAYEKAQAARIQAEKEHSAAKIAVQEYSEGTYLKELKTLQAAVTVAQENMNSAKNTLDHTIRLARKGYVTSLQRESQEFAVQRAQLDLDAAVMAVDVLEKFTRAKMLEDLTSKEATAEAKMRSELASLTLEESKLKRLESQVANSVIVAPADGMVVFANDMNRGRGGGQQGAAVEEGAAVRERQTLVRLPDLSKMQVKVIVHESKVDLLKPGMPAKIKIQGREFHGAVTSVANQPESGSWFGSNVKEYAAIVRIEGQHAGLKPGMTAEVEIEVANLKDIISVPVIAVVERGGKFYCWVRRGGSPKPVEVVIGASNTTKIEIKDGLVEGDQVLLNPRVFEAELGPPSGSQGDGAKKDGEGPADAKKVEVPTGPTVPGLSKTPEEKAAESGDQPGPGGGAPGGPGSGKERGKGGPGGGRGGFGDWRALDLDKDGKLSKDEAPEPMKAFFDNLDKNGDGFADDKEMSAAMAAMKKMQQGGAGGPGGPGPGGPPPGGN